MNLERSKLRQAMLEAADREFAAMPPREALEAMYPPSPRFAAGMEALVRRTIRRYVQIGRRVFRRAAVAVIILALLLCGCMAVPAVRSFVIETYQGFSSFRFPMDEEHPGPYGMGGISLDFPEGFHLKEDNLALRFIQLTLETDDGQELELTRVTRGMTLLIGQEDAPDAVSEERDIGGRTCFLHSAGDVSTILWTEGEYAYRLRGSCDMAVLERFVELYEP